MKRHVLSADALLAFLEDRPGAAAVETLCWKAVESQQSVFMSVVSWGAVYCAVQGTRGEKAAKETARHLDLLPIETVDADAMAASIAASFSTVYKLPYTDCFALAAASQKKATLLTTNREFLKAAGEVKVVISTEE